MPWDRDRFKQLAATALDEAIVQYEKQLDDASDAGDPPAIAEESTMGEDQVEAQAEELSGEIVLLVETIALEEFTPLL